MVVGVALAVLVATAGCSGLLGSSETELLLVNNVDGADHDVTVEIEQDGNTVFSDEVAVNGEQNVELGSFEGTGEHTVVVTVDGTATESSYTFSEGDGTVSIGIQNDGSVVVGSE
jgi:hypothetical protein